MPREMGVSKERRQTTCHIFSQELSKVLALNDVEIVAIGKKVESLEDYFLKKTKEV